jgi:putative RecB family exonuclease
MPIYSYSKISAFEQCPLKYKFRYIDNIVIIEKNIESFLGKMVHSALEWLYLEVKKGFIPSLDELIFYYAKNWKSQFDLEPLIINGNFSVDDFYNRGIKFLADYYIQHHPFDDNTIEVEKGIEILLDKGKNYKIKGFIDRLVYNLKTGEYEVHDYKTSNSAPSQEKIDTDKQLALYSIAIKELFGEDKNVLLVWHYLAYNRKIHSRRSDENLKEFRKEIIDLITKIESTKDFPAKKSALCNWCEYKKICPAFTNEKFFLEKNETLDKWD